VTEFDRRPGELALRTDRRVVASSALQGIGDLYLLAPGVTYLIDAPIAADFRDQDRAVEIVDADRGEFPRCCHRATRTGPGNGCAGLGHRRAPSDSGRFGTRTHFPDLHSPRRRCV
jgi:hypothetical protein